MDNKFNSGVCPKCGNPVNIGDEFCGECGANLKNPDAPPQRFSVNIPPEIAPLHPLDYLLMMLIFSVPVIGILCMAVWSFKSGVNLNRRNFSRAFMLYYIAILIASIILMMFFKSVISSYAGIM